MTGPMADLLKRADELTRRLQQLAAENHPVNGKFRRGGDEIATDQLATFGELLVVLARQLVGKRQHRRGTWRSDN